MIEIEALSKTYGEATVVADVTMAVPADTSDFASLFATGDTLEHAGAEVLSA